MLPCASVMVGTTSSGKVAGRSGGQSDPRANLMAVEVADAMESEVCQFPQAVLLLSGKSCCSLRQAPGLVQA